MKRKRENGISTGMNLNTVMLRSQNEIKVVTFEGISRSFFFGGTTTNWSITKQTH